MAKLENELKVKVVVTPDSLKQMTKLSNATEKVSQSFQTLSKEIDSFNKTSVEVKVKVDDKYIRPWWKFW